MKRIASVWNQALYAGPLSAGAHIGTGSLHNIVQGLDFMWWPSGDAPLPEVRRYDALIVHLFEGMTHVEQIRRVHPTARIVALPDAYMDEVFLNDAPYAERYMRQLQAADIIGYVSASNRRFYRALLPGKPLLRFPIPIGTPAFFEMARAQPKQGFVLAVDHGPRATRQSMATVAAVAAIQRVTGRDACYVGALDETRRYAEMAGLRAFWPPRMPYDGLVQLAARAWLGVDLYTLHGMGRHEMTLAYAGTPCIGSDRTSTLDQALKVEAWNATGAAQRATNLARHPADYAALRDRLWRVVERGFGFEAVRRQWASVERAIWR